MKMGPVLAESKSRWLNTVLAQKTETAPQQSGLKQKVCGGNSGHTMRSY